jgi:hypothetical protein
MMPSMPVSIAALQSDQTALWGNGLKINMFGTDGQLSNVVFIGCHPELPAHDALQAMTIEQMVDRAAEQLRAEKYTAF